MKVLVCLDDNGIITTYSANSKEELNQAAKDIISAWDFNGMLERMCEPELLDAYKSNSENLYDELKFSYIENLDINKLEIQTVKGIK